MKEVYVAKTASRGIAVAKVLKYQEPDYTPDRSCITEEQTDGEKAKFAKAKETVKNVLSALAAENEIFAAHLDMVDDFTLQEGVDGKITGELKNAQVAVHETIQEIAALFGMIDDEYMKERATDIQDVGKRLMAELKGISLPDIGSLAREAIIVAKDLYPSDTVKINPDFVKGIITEEGGVTSHVSIIAKSMNIPTLVGVGALLDSLSDNTVICMDAEKGIIVVDPDEKTLAEYQARKEDYEKERIRLLNLRNTPPVTADGKRISLCANVGNLEDIQKALEMNIDGIGLFRSEFLYMENTHFPTEEEQFDVYSKAAQLCPRELTIRTLDIGGDKELSYFEFDKEENPFLGWRAIRISLDMKDMFKQQLRAILRAGVYGHVRIMFPMMISLEELRAAKEVVEECKAELKAEGKAYDEKIELGMMIETPASVLMAEEFAKEADFFSIGTNDLTQYLLAIDRGNKKLADKYDYFHPAVLKAIAHVIKAGHQEGIKVGMCGEMAGDAKAVKKLLEMELDEFSMSAGSIDYVREQILNG